MERLAIRVPRFKRYFPTIEDMDIDQRVFYQFWRESWQEGKVVAVDGQISYLFCYLNSILTGEISPLLGELHRLRKAYSMEKKFAKHCAAFVADCYLALGNYQLAIEYLPRPSLGSVDDGLTDFLLTLKALAGRPLDGRDLLGFARCRLTCGESSKGWRWTGPKITSWGRKHLDELAEYTDIVVAAYQRDTGIDLLSNWAIDTRTYQYRPNYSSEERSPLSEGLKGVHIINYSLNPRVKDFAHDQVEEAENTVREEFGIPRIGEGWVAETELFYKLRRAFPKTQVVHHGRPEWLGRQHIDIYFPDLGVGVEYQGMQHDRPVEFFGGEKSYEQNRKRDARKRRLCGRNEVTLIEVRPGYDFEALVDRIGDSAREYNTFK